MRNGAFHSPLRSLRKDLSAVARDAEALLGATADSSSRRIQEVRARTERTLRQAIDHLDSDRLQRRVRKAARQTDSYVRDHSWGAIGLAAGIGLLIGWLARRGR
jgi:ElaB/YqjD/DUF883 family membrane-anchored ribosome-binding protein